MAVPIDVSQLLTGKRERKRERRSAREQKRHLASVLHRRLKVARFGDRSKIIFWLAEKYRGELLKGKNSLTVPLPSVFSIIENPVGTVAAIQAFAKTIRQRKFGAIRIDQGNIKSYDLAAMALLDTVVTEIQEESRQHGRKVRFSGVYPTDRAIQRFIRSMGVVKHLGVAHEIATGAEIAKLRLFDKRQRHYYARLDPKKADSKTRTITGFVDHIDECLGDHNRVLTPESKAKLCDYIGEILGNAEEHAGEKQTGFVDWTIQGYLDNGLDVPICEITIFNFGKSIAQTFKDLPNDHYTILQIQPYITRHSMHQWFGHTWRLSDLYTLVALQGHVSSKNRSKADTRGQGMGDLIDFFQRVHQECVENKSNGAKMAIVSGGTYILFDGTYAMRDQGNRGRVIAFNAKNDLYEKPDGKFVKPLGNLHFPGTVISIRFPLSVDSKFTMGD